MSEATTENPTTEGQTTNGQPQQPIAPLNARFALPANVVAPIAVRNELVKRGIAPATLKPQQMYAYVKSPGKTDPFPVKWYDAAGNVFDTQPGGVLTRPGLPDLEEAIAWYIRRNTKPAGAQESNASQAPQANQIEANVNVGADEDAPSDEDTEHEEAE